MITRVPRLSLLFALALVLPASGQEAARLALYVGPVPNPNGLVTPVSRDFANSYADLEKAHKDVRLPVITLVDDPAQADAILSVTFRGDVDNGTSLAGNVPPISMGVNVSGTQHVTPTLRARLTVRATGEGADFAGVSADTTDRTKWSTQARRIYEQAVAWLTANEERLIRLRR